MPKLTPIIASTSAQSGVSFGKASEAAMGAGEAQGLQSIGTAVSGLGQVLKKREDDAEVSRVNRQLAEAHAAMTVDWNERYQKADPNDKELAQRFNEEWAQKLDELGQGIDSNVARRHFDGTSAKMKADFYAHSMVGQAQLGGIREREDFEAANGARKTSVYNAPYTLNDKLAEYDADMERRITNGQLRRDQAEQMRNRDRLDMTMNAVSGVIKVSPDEAQRLLDSGKYDHLMTGDAKKHAYAELKSKRHQDVVEQNARIAIQERAIKARQELTQQDLLSEMVAGRLTTDKIMNSNLDAFGTGGKKAFLEMLDQHNKGGGAVTNPEAYYALSAMAHTPELKEQFLKTDLVKEYSGQLSPSHLIKFVDLQSKSRSGNDKALSEGRSNLQIAKDTLRESGIKNPEAEAKFHRAFEEENDAFIKQHGRPPTNEEKRGIADGLMVQQVTSKGWLWDTKKAGYELAKDKRGVGPMAAPTIADIPKDRRQIYESYLKSKGFPVSESKLLKMFQADKESQKASK